MYANFAEGESPRKAQGPKWISACFLGMFETGCCLVPVREVHSPALPQEIQARPTL